MTNAFLIEEFVAMPRSSLLGFARVRTPSGMVFHDTGIYKKDSAYWASPASKPRLGRDGLQMKDQAGKGMWQPIVTFCSKDVRNRWSDGVIDAMRMAHPELFNG